MKKFLRGILTIWLTLLLIILGIVLNFKSILINTTDTYIKKEISNNLVATMKEYAGEEINEEVIKNIRTKIESNTSLQQIMNTYYDKIINSISGDSVERIDVSSDLKNIMEEGEEILKEYGIMITEEEKNELFAMVSNEEVNTLINDSITELKNDMSAQAQEMIRIYKFLTSTSFKITLIGLIIVSLVLIALLKKSYYRWLTNFGASSLITGLGFSILLPYFVKVAEKELASTELVINTSSLVNYGYVLIGLGILSYILYFVFAKLNKKQKESQPPKPITEQESIS